MCDKHVRNKPDDVIYINVMHFNGITVYQVTLYSAILTLPLCHFCLSEITNWLKLSFSLNKRVKYHQLHIQLKQIVSEITDNTDPKILSFEPVSTGSKY